MSVANLDAYRKKIEEQVEAEQRGRQPKEKDGGGEGPPIEFVRKCYLANEVGDSLLYNHLHRDRFVHNVIAKDNAGWLRYVGPHWEFDYHKESKAAVEAVAQCYLSLLQEVEEQLRKLAGDDKEERKALNKQRTALIDRLNRLRSDRGRSSVLACAISNKTEDNDPLTVHPDRLDQEPWLLPVANGLIDLRTGEFREGGDPRLYLTLASPTRWEGIDCPCPTWERFLDEVLDGKREVIDYLHKVLGYTITGLRSERLFVVFHGPHGHNGKDTLIGAVQHVLGPLAGPVQTELLMSQRFSRNTSGPSPDILALKGLRLAYAAETEKGNSFAAGQIKRFSGGNQLIGRGLNDKEQTYFWPTHTLFLICNDLPSAPAKDSAFWERIRVFVFPWSYVAKPKESYQRLWDPELDLKLRAEAPGILAWLVRGCIRWQREGLIAPQKVLDDSRAYRAHEDDLQQFIDECCTVDFTDATTGNATNASMLYQRYRTWWEAGHTSMRGALSSKDFSDELVLKGFTKFKSNKIFYQFIQIRPELDQKPEVQR
ncbi:MAG: phage/plasmid primase, P4 family [Desulfofustis sp.]|jgi:putative DNA primase/helicase|nr:phage/plasmid primase, P4 family [Desulfofustis sp.]